MREHRSRNKRRPARARILLLALAVSVVTLGGPPALARPSEPRGTKRVRSLKEIRQDRVVLQKWDLSCGSAALSTLLTFDLDDPIGEPEIITTILRRADPVKIRARQGFSLLDLKKFSVSRGHDADGYGKLDLKHLAQLAPAIVPTVIGGNDHFVVVRGIQEGRVIIADPGFGNRTMTVERFEALWPKRIAFVVRPTGDERLPLPRDGEDEDLTVVRPSVLREAVGALR